MKACFNFLRPRVTHALRLLPALLVCLLLGVRPSDALAAETDGLLEYRIKGAYLFNFTRFVNWPSTAFESPSAPIRIGVLHADAAAAAAVMETINGKATSSGRIIEVRPYTKLDPTFVDCHVVFVTRSAVSELPAIRARIGLQPVLLVGETDDFATHGGIINLVLAGSTVRCEINLKRAETAGLKLSGRLSSVARIVRDSPRS
jgi:hypothetical protein